MTHKQHQMLQYIYNYIQEHGMPPRYKEMQEYFGLKSRASVHHLVTRLCNYGALERRDDIQSRNLIVKMTPEQVKQSYIQVE